MYRKSESYLINGYPLGAPPPGLGSASPGPGAGADMGGERTYAVRGTLDFKLGEDGLFRLSVNHAQGRMTTGPYQSKSTIGVLQVVPVPGNPNNVELVNVIDTPANETRLSILGNADGGGNAIDGSSFLPGAGIGTSEEIAEGIEYLARAEWVTGVALEVDGGLGLGVSSFG